MAARNPVAKPDVSARLSALHARVDAMKSQQAAVALELTEGGPTRNYLQRELKEQRMFHRQMAAVDIGYAEAVGDARSGDDFVEFTDGGRQRMSVLRDGASARSLAHALDDLRSHSDLMTSVLVDLARSNETNRANLQQVQSITRAARDEHAVSSSARAAALHRSQSRAAQTSLLPADDGAARASHAPPLPLCILHAAPFAGAASLQVTTHPHPPVTHINHRRNANNSFHMPPHAAPHPPPLPLTSHPSPCPQCCVCLGALERGQQAAALPCGHVFHADCMKVPCDVVL
jgi:hypothetical protein